MIDLSKIKKHFYPYRILDIGANIGQFYKLAKTYFPDSFVFCIEANEYCEPYLKQITTDYYIGLLAKDNSEYTFFSTETSIINTGNSIYKELTNFYSDDKLITNNKKGIKLDDLFESESEFDLIKIDTQGSELDIIEGGKVLCKKAKGILLEVSITQYNEGAPLYNDVLIYMKNMGYECFDILDETNIPGVIHQQDLLFIKK